MTSYPEARWINEVILDTIETFVPMFEEALKKHVPDGYPVGYQPMTWKDLKQLERDDAIQRVANMMMQPLTQRDGFALARRLADELGITAEGSLGSTEEGYA